MGAVQGRLQAYGTGGSPRTALVQSLYACAMDEELGNEAMGG